MILADTGFWVALAYPRDDHHEAARAALNAHAGEGFVSTWSVITEAVYLIGKRQSRDAAVRFVLDVGQGACTVHPPSTQDLPRLHALMLKYRDLPMDLADASLVLLAEYLDEGRILSTNDRDFRAYKWKNRKPFKNLLLTE